VAIPFFSFPKVLTREKEKIRLVEKARLENEVKKAGKQPAEPSPNTYGKDIKGW